MHHHRHGVEGDPEVRRWVAKALRKRLHFSLRHRLAEHHHRWLCGEVPPRWRHRGLEALCLHLQPRKLRPQRLGVEARDDRRR